LRRLTELGNVWRESTTVETPQQLRDSPRRSQVADLGEAGHALFPQLALRALDLRIQRPERPCLLLLVPIPAGLAPVEGLGEPHRGLALWRIDLPEQP
jgi:hypothetical protein